MENLVKAIIAVMAEVENIDKSMTVGTGANSYSGVADKDVKKAIGKAMQNHGLVCLPVSIDPKCQVDRWEEENQYGKKMKQNVFVEVETTYMLAHVSGENIMISGYGHGVDSQDKAAGKATTYALKNALLYSFLVPTTKIDDADKTHSDDMPTPPPKPAPQKPVITEWMSEVVFKGICKKIESGKPDEIEDARKLANAYKTPPRGMKKEYAEKIRELLTQISK
jgi:hypothetical protein